MGMVTFTSLDSIHEPTPKQLEDFVSIRVVLVDQSISLSINADQSELLIIVSSPKGRGLCC
jgi:hypothetical protein